MAVAEFREVQEATTNKLRRLKDALGEKEALVCQLTARLDAASKENAETEKNSTNVDQEVRLLPDERQTRGWWYPMQTALSVSRLNRVHSSVILLIRELLRSLLSRRLSAGAHEEVVHG